MVWKPSSKIASHRIGENRLLMSGFSGAIREKPVKKATTWDRVLTEKAITNQGWQNNLFIDFPAKRVNMFQHLSKFDFIDCFVKLRPLKNEYFAKVSN
jgi:hypothetical protein